MDHSNQRKLLSRKRRAFRVRNKVRGSAEKPRLTVSKTNKHLYAQLVDDEQGISLAGVGTLNHKSVNRKSKQAARAIGKQIGELAKEKNIRTVVFDRGVNKYHGVIAELADGAREAGLQF